MTMDTGGDRPDDGAEEPAGPSDKWFFDLPTGAWERQEAKNRELRARVHSNLEEDPPHPDPFAAKKDENRASLPRPEKKKGESDGRATPGGTFRLARPGESVPASSLPDASGDNDWSTEPALPLRRRTDVPPPSPPHTAAEAAPPESGDSAGILSNMRKWAASSLAGRDAAPDAGPPAPDGAVHGDDHAQPPPTPFTLPLRLHRPEPEVADDEPEAHSRWKEVFSSEPGQVEGLAAMREWIEKGPVLPDRQDASAEIPADLLKPFEWESSEAAAPAPEIPAEFLKPFEWEAEPDIIVPTAREPIAAVDDTPNDEADDALLEAESTAPVSELTEVAPVAFVPKEASDDPFPVGRHGPRGAPSHQPIHESMFGRMFGRKKQRDPGSPDETDVRFAGGPGESSDRPSVRPAGALEDAGRVPVDDAPGPTPPVGPERRRFPMEERPSVSDSAAPGWRLTTGVGLDASDAEPKDAPLFETAPEALVPEPVAAPVETAWTWSEPDSAEPDDAPLFETAPEALVSEPVAAPVETPWTWNQPEVAEPEDAPLFETAPEALVSEPVAAPVETAWTWSEPDSAEPDEAPLFETAPEALVSGPVAAPAETPWTWNQPEAAEPPANEWAPESLATTESPALNEAGEDDGWDPEPFDVPAHASAPSFTLEPADVSAADVTPDNDPITFAFEPNEVEEPAAPIAMESPASTWTVPVHLSPTPPQGDQERAWWESGADNLADEPLAPASPLELAAATAQASGGNSDEAPGETPHAPAVLESAPVLLPSVDEDPWSAVSATEAEDLAPEPQPAASVPPPAQDDDPWADFMTGRDETIEVVEPAESARPDWRDIFTNARDAVDTEPIAPAEPAASMFDSALEAEDDPDPWNAIATQYETEIVPHGVQDTELDLASSLESQLAEADEMPRWEAPVSRESGASMFEAAPDDGHYDDDDVVLRAFNEKAATPEATWVSEPQDEELFGELLGAGAAELVAEATGADSEPQSFVTVQNLAPDRRPHPENPYDAPWEPDDAEPGLAGGRETDRGRFGAPIPWDNESSDSESGPVPASAHGHSRARTLVREVVETIMLAVLVFLCVRASFQNFKVDGSSMFPTLEDGQFLIVNKLVYSEVDMKKLSNFIPLIDPGNEDRRNVFHGPQRGDIVVLQDPRKPETDLIKRVIGLPGETVEIVDGKVYINDFLLEEPYIKKVWRDNRPKVLVPPGEYFVMGDNRDNSLDSRSQQVGFVPEDLVIGKAMLSYWPRSKFGLAANQAGDVSEKDGVPRLSTQVIDASR